jgi:hypothetical protein
VIEHFLAIVKTHHKFTSPYRPSTNGQVEKLNGTIILAVKKLSLNDKERWDQHLPAVLYAYRTKAHSTVDISPYELLYGQHPRAYRQDILQKVGQMLGYERLVKLVDRNVQKEEEVLDYPMQPELEQSQFIHGTKVIRVRHKKRSKLDSKFEPEVFTVISGFGNGAYQLMDQSGRILKRRVNKSSLRPFFERKDFITKTVYL